MTPSRAIVQRAAGVYPLAAYAHAVVVDRTIYISGEAPLDENERPVGVGDAGAQAERVYQNLAAVLRACGADLRHLVRLTTYLTDMKDLAVVRDARHAALGDLKVTLTTVAVSALLRPEFKITIDAIAVLDD